MRDRPRITKRYLACYGALYGDVEAPKPRKKRIKKEGEKSEQQEQYAVHDWMTKKGIIHHHSPNGGKRNQWEGVKFKAMGVSPGYPDLTIPYARKGHHGLYIELKRVSGGKLSSYQEFWRDHLLSEGHYWAEAKGATECINIICDYLEIDK